MMDFTIQINKDNHNNHIFNHNNNINTNNNNHNNQLIKDNFAFATYNDGLIYQYVPYNQK